MTWVHFATFQGLWFAAVFGAAGGSAWLGPLALIPHLALHFAGVERGARGREVVALAVAGAGGTLIDAGLHAVGVTGYPGSATPFGVLPPVWITALWIGFASLPRYSLAWLRGRAALAAAFGAIGGPLSYWGGVTSGATEWSNPAWRTAVGLGVEYAIVTPALLAWMPRGKR